MAGVADSLTGLGVIARQRGDLKTARSRTRKHWMRGGRPAMRLERLARSSTWVSFVSWRAITQGLSRSSRRAWASSGDSVMI